MCLASRGTEAPPHLTLGCGTALYAKEYVDSWPRGRGKKKRRPKTGKGRGKWKRRTRLSCTWGGRNNLETFHSRVR